MKRLVILHNQMAPYRLPLFDALARRYGALRVLFCYERGADRLWSTSISDYAFSHRMLPQISIGLKNRRVYFNPAIVREILAGNVDAVVITLNPETLLTSWLAYTSCKVRGVPFCIWIAHHMHRRYRPKTLFEKMIYRLYMKTERLLVQQSRSVIAYGQTTRAYVNEYLGKPLSQVFVGTQVSTKSVAPIVRDFTHKPLGLLYIGYLVKGKRIQDLIEALQSNDSKEFELIIAGDGPEKKRLETIAGRDNRIRFAGYVEGEAKDRLFRKAHVFVTPSEHDNMPNSIIEAMSYGLPLVATRQCHCPEWLKENAMVFGSGDSATLAAHLDYIYEHPEVLSAMSKKSKELADTYSLPYAVSAFEAAIRKATELDGP
ncbi:MAG: glycosyltransferase family 4 protein [Desulfobacteraceae bacterium]|nr:glycosyltransferase family 4 protein [Desulfobacteraceae bacterium]